MTAVLPERSLGVFSETTVFEWETRTTNLGPPKQEDYFPAWKMVVSFC